MVENLKGRLLYFIEYKKLSPKSFERLANIPNATVSRASDKMREKTLSSIKTAFPELNIEWLRYGTGQMLVPTKTKGEDEKVDPRKCIKFHVDMEASMGDVGFLDNPSERTKEIYIPGYEHCTDAITAYGDSMLPTIKSGNIVLLSRWTEPFIDYGKIYLVVTKGGYRAIKRLKKASDESKVMCVSDNPEHEPFEVEKQELILYKVHGWINREDF